jgi:hypothetical protein
MKRRTIGFIAALLAVGAAGVAAGAAGAAEEPETVYRKMHAAAVARNLDEMRLYAAEAARAELALPDVPKIYRITGKAARRDGSAVELRAAGTADSVGLGYTQMFGVIDFVREKGEWKVERLSWSTERPGEYPEGFLIVHGPAPEPRASAEAQAPRFKPPPSPPERSHIVAPRRSGEAKPEERVMTIEREPAPCVIRPVMSDEDLRACGARVPD